MMVMPPEMCDEESSMREAKERKNKNVRDVTLTLHRFSLLVKHGASQACPFGPRVERRGGCDVRRAARIQARGAAGVCRSPRHGGGSIQIFGHEIKSNQVAQNFFRSPLNKFLTMLLNLLRSFSPLNKFLTMIFMAFSGISSLNLDSAPAGEDSTESSI